MSYRTQSQNLQVVQNIQQRQQEDELKEQSQQLAQDIQQPKTIDFNKLSEELRNAVGDRSNIRLITSQDIPLQYKDKPNLAISGAFIGDDGLIYILKDNVDNIDEAIIHEKAHKLIEPYAFEATKYSTTNSPSSM